MDNLLYGIHVVYAWLRIRFNVLGFQISFWELIVYSLVAGLLWFFVRQIYNIYD